MHSIALLAGLMAPAPAAASDWVAPEGFEHAVPRLNGKTKRVFSNLLYEGNNRSLRKADPQVVAADPCADARRASELATRTAGLFVLRDALFSQQDHAVERPACALMMPVNWVTGAVDDALHGRTTAPVRAPDVEADAEWTALSPSAMFGGFQPSESLHGWASRARADANAEDRVRIENARRSVQTLAGLAVRLVEAGTRAARKHEDPSSPAARETAAFAVAREGGLIIAESDRAYFGAEVRRDNVIPLFVENPSAHEIEDEHKGLLIHGRSVDPDALRLTLECVYRLRLMDGPMAIERYDITRDEDVTRAVDVLETIVPTGSQGASVYVWVGGPLIEGSERVESAVDAVPGFIAALDAAAIERDRVHVFLRPVFQSRGRESADLRAHVERGKALGVVVGANMNGLSFKRWMQW